jgi:hypothetical protein
VASASAGAGGFGAAADSGVTLGYWKVWGEGGMSISFYAPTGSELRPARVKECFAAPTTAPSQLLVAFSRQVIVADEEPDSPSS